MTKVASIVVAGLYTSSEWMDHFIVECYTDAGLTNKVNAFTSRAQWDGSFNNQMDLISFNGLTYGATYFLRAGVITPVTGAISWSSTFAIVAGANTSVSGTSYSVNQNTVPGGMSFDITPLSAPANIDHYEAVWTLDNAVPPRTAQPNWKGSTVSGAFTFHIMIQWNQSVGVFIRAVNTSSDFEDWVRIGPGAISPGTIDALLDGAIYGRVSNNGLTGGLIDSRKSGVIKLGSLCPAFIGNGVLTYTATSDSTGASWITFSWTTFFMRMIDGGAVTVSARSGYTITGLSPSKNYYFYPFVDAFSNPASLQFVGNIGDGSSVGTDGAAHIAPSDILAQQQNLQNHNGCSSGSVLIATPAKPSSGTSGGSGTGGGGGTDPGGHCVRFGTKVESQRRGIVLAETVTAGEKILGRNKDGDNVWMTVKKIAFATANTLVRIKTITQDVIEQTPFTPMYMEDWALKYTYDLSVSDILQLRDDKAGLIDELKTLRGAFDIVKITLEEEPHCFFAGEVEPNILTHNIVK